MRPECIVPFIRLIGQQNHHTYLWNHMLGIFGKPLKVPIKALWRILSSSSESREVPYQFILTHAMTRIDARLFGGACLPRWRSTATILEVEVSPPAIIRYTWQTGKSARQVIGCSSAISGPTSAWRWSLHSATYTRLMPSYSHSSLEVHENWRTAKFACMLLEQMFAPAYRSGKVVSLILSDRSLAGISSLARGRVSQAAGEPREPAGGEGSNLPRNGTFACTSFGELKKHTESADIVCWVERSG